MPQDGPRMTDTAKLGPLSGRLERADRQAISGWAQTQGDGAPVVLELLVNEEPAGRFTAQAPREDLRKAGLGDGRHGFSLHLPHGLSAFGDHVVRVRRAADGVELPGSPLTIPAAAPQAGAPETAVLNAAARASLRDALEAAASGASPAEIEAMIGFLARQTATLLFAHGSGLPDPQAALLARWGLAPAIAQQRGYKAARLVHRRGCAGCQSRRRLQRRAVAYARAAPPGLAGGFHRRP